MSIILYGVTSGGTSVPIEVTEEGKLVVDTSKFPTDEFIKQGDDIEAGSIIASGDITSGAAAFTGPGTNLFPSGACYVQSTSGSTDTAFQVVNPDNINEPKVTIKHDGSISTDGSITADGTIQSGGNPNSGTDEGVKMSPGGGLEASRDTGTKAAIRAYTEGTSAATFVVTAGGSIAAVSGKCGFTADGELYFYSQGARYRAVVQAGNMMAEPYTRAIEFQEKAEKLRQPKTQDIVPED